MKTQIDRIEDVLKLRTGLGPGKGHLTRHEGELTVTNRIGLAAGRK